MMPSRGCVCLGACHVPQQHASGGLMRCRMVSCGRFGRFGADYYSFWWGGVRGLVLNTHLWASSSANPVSGADRSLAWSLVWITEQTLVVCRWTFNSCSKGKNVARFVGQRRSKCAGFLVSKKTLAAAAAAAERVVVVVVDFRRNSWIVLV